MAIIDGQLVIEEQSFTLMSEWWVGWVANVACFWLDCMIAPLSSLPRPYMSWMIIMLIFKDVSKKELGALLHLITSPLTWYVQHVVTLLTWAE